MPTAAVVRPFVRHLPARSCCWAMRAPQGQLRRLGTRTVDADTWLDGTPKKFRGREAWKNWIEWDSPHREQTDELNRQRHYFWHVDTRGRLWRKELDRLDANEGQMRDSRVLDHFFGHMQRNSTGLHAESFPYVSFRMHEHYFTSCADAPIVFNDLREGNLLHMCPDGELARSITTLFVPQQLRIKSDGKLYHPVATKAVDAVGGPQRRETLMALIESSTAQVLLESCEEQEAAAGAQAELVLRWLDSETVLQRWEDS